MNQSKSHSQDEKIPQVDSIAELFTQRQNTSLDVLARLAGVNIRLITHRTQAFTDHVMALLHCANPVDMVTLTNQYVSGAAADYMCAGRQWALMLGRDPPPCTLPNERPTTKTSHSNIG